MPQNIIFGAFLFSENTQNHLIFFYFLVYLLKENMVLGTPQWSVESAESKTVELDKGQYQLNINLEKINTLTITSKNNFFLRLWYCISNPFLYILKGKIRY